MRERPWSSSRARSSILGRSRGLGGRIGAAAGGVSLLLALTGPLVPARPVTAQQTQTPPNRGGLTTSMGLPPKWRFSVGGTTGIYRGGEDSQVSFLFNAGVYHDLLLPPVTSALGVLGEAYVGRRGGFKDFGEGLDGGFRILGYSPFLRLAGGYDYSVKDERGDFILSLIHPIQRGGIFTNGGSFRVDWIPGRGHTTAIGLHIPVGQRWVGVSRPRHDHVRLPYHESPELSYVPEPGLQAASDSFRELGRWVNRLTVPFTDQWDGDQDRALELFSEEMQAIRARLESDAAPHYAGRRTAVREVAAFHDELDRAFSIAVTGREHPVGSSNELGREVADRAREAVLNRLIVPYDRLLGQKRRRDSTRGLGAEAAAEFFEWLTSETPVERARLQATVWTFERYADLLETIRVRNLEQWDEERFVWLPYQLALRADQHDEQEELDALVEQATGDRFVRGNEIWYVENEQWQAELSRMILQARDYHVVWLHDFRGYDAGGDPDQMSFMQVSEAYLPALIAAVRRYDETGKIPQYIQIFDQFYFSANGGELWADLLEHPLEHRIDLPVGWEAWEDSIAGLQDQLREAVEESELLQAQEALFGEEWLKDLVKVHVNITQPPDPSFWSAELFPSWMGLPDTPMRDHRKISFYDASEADPYAGQGIYTGMGVGEHYIGAGWEDRAVLVHGPVVLDLRDSARELLLTQGFEEYEIPWELQPKEYAPDYDEKIEAFLIEGGDYGSEMETHNAIGYGPKGVSVLKAVLYTLMPPGSVIKAPDSIWGSNLWASMMLGNALRGGRSLIMAPGIDNAPSAGSPQMSRAQEALTRVVVAQEILGDLIEGEGGLLKLGLYSTDLEVGDVPGRIGSILATLDATPWLADLYGFHPEVLEGLAEERDELIRAGYERTYAVDQEIVPAKLHMKAHLFYSREAWENLLVQPGLEGLMRAHFEEMAAMNLALANAEYRNYRLYSDRMDDLALEVFGPLLDRPEEELSRYAMFLSVGSQNQNSRSLALDGEVAVVAASWSALVGLMDFITVAGLCTWVETVDDLEALFPGYDGLARRLSRWIRVAV